MAQRCVQVMACKQCEGGRRDVGAERRRKPAAAAGALCDHDTDWRRGNSRNTSGYGRCCELLRDLWVDVMQRSVSPSSHYTKCQHVVM